MPAPTAAELAAEQAEATATNDELAGDPASGADTGAVETRSIMDTPPAERIPPSRNAFEEIVANRRRQLMGDGVELSEAPQTDEEAEASRAEAPAVEEVIAEGREGDDAAAAATVAAAAAAVRRAPATVDKSTKVKIKVYGEEQEISLEEAIALAQRAKAGDLKFTAAERMLDEAKKLREAAPVATTTERTEATPTGAAKVPAAEPASDAGKGIDVKRLANDLQIGDPESAEKALQTLLDYARTGNRPIGDEELQTLVDRKVNERLAAKQVVSDYESDLHTIAGEYTGLFEDNDYAKIAGEKVHEARARELEKLGYPREEVGRLLGSAGGRNQLMKLMLWENSRGNGASNIALFREVCDAVSTKFKIPVVKAAPRDPRTPAVGARTERRRTAPQPPASASARAPGGPTVPVVPTSSQVFQEMKRARGQMI